MELAVLGLGTMGKPIAMTLTASGHSVTTWSRSGRHLGGISAARDPAAAVRKADVVVLSLADDSAVLEVLGQLADDAAIHEDHVVLDMSTIAPSTAKEADDIVRGRCGAYLDAPVSGGPAAAAAGTLTIMVGGPAQVVERVSEILDALASSVLHAGPVGSGQALKLCCQSAVAIQMNMIAQLSSVAQHHAIPLHLLQQALTTSTAGNHMARTRFPTPGVLPDSPASNDWRCDFSGRLMTKDVRLAASLIPAGSVVDGLDAALDALTRSIARGDGDLDWSKAFAPDTVH